MEENRMQKAASWKLVALDLDGTTLHSDKSLSERTRAALEACAKEQMKIVIASGRAFTSLPRDLLGLPGVEYAITSNGAAIYQAKTGERLFHFPMEEEKTVQVLKLLEEHPVHFEVFVDGVAYATEDYVEHPERYGLSEHGTAYIKQTRHPVADLSAFAWAHAGCLDCIDLIVKKDEDRRYFAERLLQIGGMYVTSSVAYLLEIANQAAGKGAALRTLAEKLGIFREEILAFGNEENDLDMILYAGLGIAVENSPRHVRELADAVTKSNDADGVAIYLEKILGQSET